MSFVDYTKFSNDSQLQMHNPVLKVRNFVCGYNPYILKQKRAELCLFRKRGAAWRTDESSLMWIIYYIFLPLNKAVIY
jgi:hypothetical protein